VGSLFAGIFALAWWPWAFWSFAIVLALIAVVSYFVIPDPPKKKEVARMSLRQKLAALDIGGAVLGITALVLINFAWNQAPIVGWDKPYVYITLIIGALFACAFFFVELRVVSDPLIPFHAFTSDVCFVLGCISCGWASFGIWVYYLWVFLTQLRGSSPLLATAQISPLAISGGVAAIGTGFALSRVRPAIIMTVAMCAFLVGNILIGTAPVDQTYWAQPFVCTLIIPFGMDMSFPAATVILSNAVEKKHQGIAASLINTIVNYSISLGLGFAATVEVYTTDGSSNVTETGLRHAYYMSFGLAGLGLFISLCYVAKGYWNDQRTKPRLADSHA
jgi:MFS family permease